MSGMTRYRIAIVTLSTLAAIAACGAEHSPTTPDPVGAPPGADVVTPFPIDRGDASALTPGTYKGLWLRLTPATAPAVTPVDGVIGVVCVGMSNASQECADFITRRNGEYAAAIDPAVRVVNCAVGGHAIERWIDPQFDATLWDACVATKLPAAGVRLDQVRVVYHKAANQFAGPTTFPAQNSDYESFRANLSLFAARMKLKLPAVQAVYTSSRSYGGFAGTPGRGEPLSYEEGHALNRWLQDHPAVDGVWYGWGPYLWAPSCDTGITNGGGVCYDRADYVEDGVHPAPSGRAKMSALLHGRLSREAWYSR